MSQTFIVYSSGTRYSLGASQAVGRPGSQRVPVGIGVYLFMFTRAPHELGGPLSDCGMQVLIHNTVEETDQAGYMTCIRSELVSGIAHVPCIMSVVTILAFEFLLKTQIWE